jgi:hypothetical protein
VRILWFLLSKGVKFVLAIVVLGIVLWVLGMLMPPMIIFLGVFIFLMSLNPRMFTNVGVAYHWRPLVVLTFPIMGLVMLAPARAFAVWTMRFYPVGGADINYVSVPGSYWFGVEHLPLIDQTWGAAAVLLYGFVFARLAMWDRVRLRQLRTLTLSRAASVSQGLVKMQGTAQTVDPDLGPEILGFQLHPEKTSWVMNGYQPSFYLKDGTGRVLIIIDGADILLPDAVVEEPWEDVGSPLTMGAREIHLSRVRKGQTGPQRYGLMRGDTVTVIGRVEPNPAFGTEDRGNGAENMIRPSLGGFFKPVYYNMFLVADQLGDRVRRHLLSRARNNIFAGLILAAGSFWLVAYGMAAETDFVSVYGVLND